MPGNVQNAAAATTLPVSLAAAFTRIDEYGTLRSEYDSGDSQRVNIDASGRARWRLAKRLSPELMAELRAFYEARLHEAFDYTDEFGIEWTVRFASPWQHTLGMARHDATVELIEVV